MSKITAVVAVYNEEKNIEECLKTLEFADEIIVIDAQSIDKTASIAQSLGAKVITSDMMYPEQNKNLGIENASNEWVFILDADERVTPELASEIKEVAESGDYDGYWIYRRNYFLGKEIRFCGWNRDRVIRLFRKGTAVYPDKRVHGQIEFNGSSGVLKSRMEHFTYLTIDDYFLKLHKYTTWAAKDAQGKKVGILKIMFNPLMRFVKMYFLRLGFLDGVKGFILCVTAAFSVFIKYVKIYLADNQ
jgi:glycosyltransferase involved in cell wall biosynthesis